MQRGEIRIVLYYLMALSMASIVLGARAEDYLTQRYELAGGFAALMLSIVAIAFLKGRRARPPRRRIND